MKNEIDIIIVPSVIEPPPNGDKGISAMGPAIIATTARIMMAKLKVAIITENIGSSFNGRLMMKSRKKPNSTEKIMLQTNATIKVHAVGSPELDKKVETKKKFA